MYFFHICHVKAFNSACYNANSCWLALHTKYCSLFFCYLIIKWNRKLLLHGGNGLKNKNANKKNTQGSKFLFLFKEIKIPVTSVAIFHLLRHLSLTTKISISCWPLRKKKSSYFIVWEPWKPEFVLIHRKPVEDFTEDLLYLIQLSAFERLE